MCVVGEGAEAEQQLHQGTGLWVTGNKEGTECLSDHCQGKRLEGQVQKTQWGEVWAA